MLIGGGELMSSIILEQNLQGYFFDGLHKLNQKSLCPLPQSTLYYSSDVLDKFALSDTFFEYTEGRVKEKILGIKLLEATQYSRDDQKKIYKEVGDMALMICGYFAESTHKKLIDTQYYTQIGRTAYENLNSMKSTLFDIPSFYLMMSTCFESVTTLMSMMASESRYKDKHFLLFNDENVSDKNLLVSGISPTHTRKVS